MKYLTIIQKNEYGYSVSVPALPGCHSQGESEREALVNIKDAIRTYLTMDGTLLKGAKIREVEVSLAS
ncbi:MAG: type II toxin-antitoxin system HicB family antitoxin [bacterium]|nr:type II toxin-antitoxin system HicB family antitoxin [bacterium]MDZ4285952.1 type II toxin-antitoxin system HicB family antitoxin [Candidatus Sungbacteria bacterium]